MARCVCSSVSLAYLSTAGSTPTSHQSYSRPEKCNQPPGRISRCDLVLCLLCTSAVRLFRVQTLHFVSSWNRAWLLPLTLSSKWQASAPDFGDRAGDLDARFNPGRIFGEPSDRHGDKEGGGRADRGCQQLRHPRLA